MTRLRRSIRVGAGAPEEQPAPCLRLLREGSARTEVSFRPGIAA